MELEEPEKKKKRQESEMKGELGWVGGLKGQEQYTSSLALEWEPFI